MTRRPAAPKNLRIGLKWRDGRPRWEPSPASRKAGIRGLDLKAADGSWMERGAAITAADARQVWATCLRDALGDGPAALQARAELRQAVENLPSLHQVNDRHARSLVQDLIDAARQLLDGEAAMISARPAAAGRTMGALIDLYFDDPGVKISDGTREAYATQAKKIRARWANARVEDITTGEIRAWYVELTDVYSLATANQIVATMGAMLQVGVYHDWLKISPAHRLGLQKAQGRRVFWTVQEEQGFIAWSDANGYADLADGLTFMLWTGARPVDACLADMSYLTGDTWRYVPVKTRKSGREALPGLIPAVQARIARRRAQTLTSVTGAFLVNPRTGKRHDTDSFGDRFREARAKAMLAKAIPATLMHKQVRDTRDTCITRLIEVEPSLMKIGAWTGHSTKDIEEVLRDHYLVLREEGARETAAKLVTWADTNGVAL